MKVEIRQLYRDPASYCGSEIEVAGWIRTIRNSKTFGFIELNDGSFMKNLQIVFEEGVIDNFGEVAKQSQGTSIRARGTLVATPEAKQPLN